MNVEVRQGQRWKFVGHGDGVGLVHIIVICANGEVVTWSQEVDRAGIGGFSWFGPFKEFVQQFRKLT